MHCKKGRVPNRQRLCFLPRIKLSAFFFQKSFAVMFFLHILNQFNLYRIAIIQLQITLLLYKNNFIINETIKIRTVWMHAWWTVTILCNLRRPTFAFIAHVVAHSCKIQCIYTFYNFIRCHLFNWTQQTEHR